MRETSQKLTVTNIKEPEASIERKQKRSFPIFTKALSSNNIFRFKCKEYRIWGIRLIHTK